MQKYSYFYGIKGVRFIWHGTNSDPELSYKGIVLNYFFVEDYFWEYCKEVHPGLSHEELDNIFPSWIRLHSPEVKQYFIDNK